MNINLFEILIDYRSYLLEFYSKSFEIWWTKWAKDGTKGVENFIEIRSQKDRLRLPFSASAFCAKKKKTNKIGEISGMYN